jgi:hypothetical protein
MQEQLPRHEGHEENKISYLLSFYRSHAGAWELLTFVLFVDKSLVKPLVYVHE